MRKVILLLAVAATLWASAISAVSGSDGAGSIGGSTGDGSIKVYLDEKLGPIDPQIYGHFTEMTLSSFDGSVSSELLFNRKFEIQEERPDDPPIFSGAAAGWEPIALDTHVTMLQDALVSFSPTYSQRITLSDLTDVPAGIQQAGLRPVMPHVSKKLRVDHPFQFAPGESYRVRVAIKSLDFTGSVRAAIGESHERVAAALAFDVSKGDDWEIHTGVLRPSEPVENGKFLIYIDTPGTVWIDSISLVRADWDEDGFRTDVMGLTKRLKPTSIRWPGGWFVSDYHWRDGIGPVDERPVSFNRTWNTYTTNDVGIDEFVDLCRKLGAEPYITVNLGTGTPEEAAQWVQYCNGGPDTKMGRLRAENGHPEPYAIKIWTVGNEEWLPTLGGMSGSHYGRHFRNFARAMRAADPTIEIVATGAFDIPSGIINRSIPQYRFARYLPDWTKGVLTEAGEHLDYYSIHYYKPANVKGHTPEEVHRAALVIGEDLERNLNRLHQQMSQFAPGGKRYPIALDEWSTITHNDSTPQQLPEGRSKPEQIGLHTSSLTFRDALAEATVFNLMQRRPRDFVLGSRTLLYAYLRGLIAIRRDSSFMTPVAHLIELYSTHEVCQSLKTEVQSATFDSKTMSPAFRAVKGAPYLNVSARLRPDGKTVDLFVVNRNLKEAILGNVQFVGGSTAPSARVALLHADDLNSRNTFDEPERVVIKNESVQLSDGALAHRFPAHSMVRLTFVRK